VRTNRRPWLVLLGFTVLAAALGCAKIPPPSVSPVEIEETREDVKVLEKDLIAARDRAAKLTAELAQKKASLAAKKDQPEVLRKRVKELKKGSGRETDDDKEKEDKEST